MTIGVRDILSRAIACRGTIESLLLDGPSINTCETCKPFLLPLTRSSATTYTLVVYYLDNHSQLSLEGSCSNVHDSANLYELPPRWLDVNSGHCRERATGQCQW